jgi:hypothetical protein
MEADSVRPTIHEVKPAEVVEIPADIAEAIDALPGRNDGRRMELPAWVDVVLTRYWKVKRKSDIAQHVGISEGVLRRRAEELGL